MRRLPRLMREIYAQSRDAVDEHIEDCEVCSEGLEQLRSINRMDERIAHHMHAVIEEISQYTVSRIHRLLERVSEVVSRSGE